MKRTNEFIRPASRLENQFLGPVVTFPLFYYEREMDLSFQILRNIFALKTGQLLSDR